MSTTRRNILVALGGSAAYALLAYVFVQIVFATGNYPIGSDTMFYVYRGQFLYESIVNDGNWYPLWDPTWYNGVQTFRYWSPLSSYFLAATQAIMNGDPFLGYLLSMGVLCFLSGVAWLYLGIKFNRPYMGFLLGLIWFFVPNNLFMLIEEGVYARAMSMFVLPLFVAFVYDYLATQRWVNLPKIMVCFAFITMCHTGWAGMLAIALVIYLVIYALLNRKQPHGKISHIIGACALAFCLCGLWVYASLQGGITSLDSSEIMKNHFQPLDKTINPLYGLGTELWNRWENPDSQLAPYFGCAAFLIAIVGSLFATRNTMPGFLTAALVCCLTSVAAYPVLAVLPGSQYLWMLRFLSLALTFLFVSFFFWRELRKSLQVICYVLLVAEVALASVMITKPYIWITPDLHYEAIQDYSLIKEGQDLTTQRFSCVEPFGMANEIYAVCGYGDNPKPTSYGQGIQAAVTHSNIVQINEATEKGSYYYLFDRLLELGNDTILLPLSQIENTPNYDAHRLSAAAQAVGYDLVDSRNGMNLYHKNDVTGPFGINSTYSALGIGEHISTLALGFPAIKESNDNNLNDYSYEELTQYDAIYITDFVYSNKEEAQHLIKRVSDAGTRVIIMADGIPLEEETQSRTFLGLDCETINFKNGYPELKTIIGTLDTDLFPNGYANWKTVYVNGLDDVWGTVEAEGRTLDFLGTVDNDNIIVVGLGLTFFESLTQDSQVADLLSYAFKLDPTEIPTRELIPLELSYEPRCITISSPVDNVDTTLAYHDIFSSEQSIWGENNLLHVNAGETSIKLSYPYFWHGLAISGGALFLSVLFLRTTHRRMANNTTPLSTPTNKADDAFCGKEMSSSQ